MRAGEVPECRGVPTASLPPGHGAGTNSHMTTTKASPLDRLLRLFTDVRPGESVTALLLALNIFLILMAYYVLKPVREALILGEASAETKTYLSAGQVLLLAVLVPYYGKLVSRLTRRALITGVTGFFVACLGAFYALGKADVPLGIPFFLWIGIFNMMVVAQFWSFANDVYSKDQGERLFPIVGFGASLGAVVGARFVHRFVAVLGLFELMLVGAALLALQLLITLWVDRRATGEQAGHGHAGAAQGRQPTPARTSGANAFRLVFGTRYLLLMAVMLMLMNTVNTTGEYILGSIVKDAAVEHAGDGGVAAVEAAIADFYSNYFTYVNVLGLLLQLFVVSRVVKYFGVSAGILALPVVATGAYAVIAFMPLLRAVLVAKVAENSTDYSINNTVRNMLFLPCTPEQKYSAKQAIDSLFVRLGDVLSAVLVFGATTWLGLHPRGFAAINFLLVGVWLVLACRIGREYRALAASGRPPASA